MSKQNFKSHARYVPLWHFVTSFAILALLIGSIVNFVKSTEDNAYSASLLILVSLILVSIFWYARRFALVAQDRAIRAEENLRHYILTGKPLSRQLRTSQIIALRFAPDEEFVELAQRAVNEKMRSKAIKKAIKNWKADHHRA
ncbi:MAG: hypothetical protein K2P88_11675 [Chitinophagaceae bacterium]|uniref:DUF6526 family protein n=1 Tax=unclassified Paraflavitalea TaxID=2798305 RepID=UPI003D342D7F|nr:hypothetical protein [Chitinophagaceae bacterium]